MPKIKTNRKYYKYKIESWEQPVVDSTVVWMPIGGDSFGAECDLCILEQQNDPRTNHTIARAFNGSTTSYIFHTAYNNVKGSIIFYNPVPINVTNIAFWAQDGYVYRSTRSGKIYGSNDGNDWTLIKEYVGTLPTTQDYQISLSENTGYYKYYKLFSDGVFSGDDYWSFMTCTLTATQRTVIEGTSSDYDFYEDVNVPYSMIAEVKNENNKWTTPVQVGSTIWEDVTYANNMFVAVGFGGNTTTSTDGVTWATPVKVGSSISWYGVTCANNKFVAVGNGGNITNSTDGVTWTTPVQVGSNSNAWYGVTYGNGKFVAVNNYGYTTTSTDGVTWTTPVKVESNGWMDITYANNKFVAVGRNGYITTSTDGVTWTTPVQLGSNAWFGITYGNGKFVAVGDVYTTTSTDGVTWTTPVQVGSTIWEDVTYANNMFVAVGVLGSIGYTTTSTDGVTWTTPVKVGLNTWFGVTYGNGKFVAVGRNGNITTSPDYIPAPFTIVTQKEEYTKRVPLVNTKSLGSAKLNNNLIANDFTTANKLDTEFYFKPEASDKYTFYIKVNSGTNGNHRAVLGPATDGQGFGLWINNANKLALYATATNGSWSLANHVVGTTTIEANTDYWLKFSFDGSKYVYSLSTNGTTYTDEITINSTSVIYPMRIMLGWHANYYLIGGSIDLKETYFVVNDKVVWKGQQDLSTDSSLTLKMPNITKVGDVHAHSLKDQHIITNFSATNYAKFPTETIPTADAQTFEANIRYKHKKAFYPLQQGIFGETIGAPTSLFVNTSGLLQFLVSYGSGYWVNVTGTTKIAPNMWYDLKIEHDGDYYMVSSPQLDGLMWRPVELTNLNELNITFTNVVYGNNMFVATGYHSSKTYSSTSTDGFTWTTPVQLFDDSIHSIAYGNGKFVAVGYKGETRISVDGITWSTPVKVGSNTLEGVTYANGKFVAVGNNGTTTTSTDGVTWTTPVQIEKPTGTGSITWFGITYGNDKFVVVGYGGYISTSTDGLTWTTPVQVENITSFNDIAYGNNKFVAVGYSYINNTFQGTTLTSVDGITWTTPQVLSSSIKYLRNIIFVDSKFVLCGDSAGTNNNNGYFSTSIDGITWATPVQIGTNVGHGLAKGNGRYICGGVSGYMYLASEIVVANTNKTPNRNYWALGCISNTYSLGEIDLEHSNIKINGETWWEGVTQEEVIDSTHYDTKTTKIRRFI